MAEFAEASAKKDYQTLCDELLAPRSCSNVEQYGLPCELAIKQGLGDVRDPKLTLGAITVTGDRATARVTTRPRGSAAPPTRWPCGASRPVADRGAGPEPQGRRTITTTW